MCSGQEGPVRPGSNFEGRTGQGQGAHGGGRRHINNLPELWGRSTCPGIFLQLLRAGPRTPGSMWVLWGVDSGQGIVR
jgi:hypothetical protein